MTLEYAYQDWCLAQLALALGRPGRRPVAAGAVGQLPQPLGSGGAIDAAAEQRRLLAARPSSRVGPHSAKGFCEANAAMYTHFVPHDVPGLIALFGGPEKYVAALDRAIQAGGEERLRDRARQAELLWVDYGNQPSTAMAHMFNLAGAPWLSQKWVRAVKEQTYGDITPNGGYSGDEDQGQMGALGVLMAIGPVRRARRGRREAHLPDHQPGLRSRDDPPQSRLFRPAASSRSSRGTTARRTSISSGPGSTASRWTQCWFDHAQLVGGGALELDLGPKPNKRWGIGSMK